MTNSLRKTGWTDTHDVFRPEVSSVAHIQKIKENLYDLRMLMPVSSVNSLNDKYMLRMATNQGDIYAPYENAYTPLLKNTPVIDGKYSPEEWPLHGAQTFPLEGYYVSKEGKRNVTVRGQGSLTFDKNNLYGLVTLFKSEKGHFVTLEIAPRDPQTGLVIENKIIRIVVQAKELQINDQVVSGSKVVSASLKSLPEEKTLRSSDLIEFSIPLAALPGLKMADGTTFGLKVHATDPDAKKDTATWHLDATWPKRDQDEDQESTDAARWGTLMVVD